MEALFQHAGRSLPDEDLADSFKMARKMAAGALLLGAARGLFVKAEPCRPAASLTGITFASRLAFTRVHLLASNKFVPAKALTGVFCTRQRHAKLAATIHAIARSDRLAPPLGGRSQGADRVQLVGMAAIKVPYGAIRGGQSATAGA